MQSFENEGFSKIAAKKQAFAAILPELGEELGNVYMDRLQWMSQLKRDPVHRKIMKTRDAFVAEDEFDPDEALVAAVKKRKFLLERMLENRQHFPDDQDEDRRSIWGRGEGVTRLETLVKTKLAGIFKTWRKAKQELLRTSKKLKELHETNARFMAFAKKRAPWLVLEFSAEDMVK